MKAFAIVALALLAASGLSSVSRPAAEYLYLWTGSADSTQPDFLAVLDVSEDSSFVRLVTTVPVPGRRNGPHHTDYELAQDRQLFVSGFPSGHTFIFDLTRPAAPRLAGQFGDIEVYSHPHSFVRLPNGNVLATFQMRHDAAGGGMTPGGLVELTPAGRPIRTSSANAPGIDPTERVYSSAIVPRLDRIVTTTTDMDPSRAKTREIQIWRLSDLALLHTITLPNGPAGTESQLTAEPRLLSDGRTVLVSTFSCGLYLIEGLESDAPSGRLVSSFPRTDKGFCAVPVVVGHYYLVTVPAWNAVVSLDISDPSAPREVSRVALGPGDIPHWIALSPNQRRVVVTGYGDLRNRVMMLRFDPLTGALTLDQRFRERGATEPGFRMDDKTWPHGGSAKGIPHGAVFSRP